MQGDEIKNFAPRRISNQLERDKPTKLQAPKMVTARFSRSVSQPHLDYHVNSAFLWLPPCLDLFHQSVGRSNYLAASVARWSLVFHFFSCLDRHHCLTQGWFCATISLPLSSVSTEIYVLPSFEFKQHGIANWTFCSFPTINHTWKPMKILK